MDDPDDSSYARAPEPEDLVRICRALNERYRPSRRRLAGERLAGETRAQHPRRQCGCGLAYADVAADMEWHDLSGVRVPVASPAALVRTKDTHRPQDTIDRSFLQQILERRRGKP